MKDKGKNGELKSLVMQLRGFAGFCRNEAKSDDAEQVLECIELFKKQFKKLAVGQPKPRRKVIALYAMELEAVEKMVMRKIRNQTRSLITWQDYEIDAL